MKRYLPLLLVIISSSASFVAGTVNGIMKERDDLMYITATKGAVKNVISYVYDQTHLKNGDLPDSVPIEKLSFYGAKLDYIKDSENNVFSIDVIKPEADIYSVLFGISGKREELERLTELTNLYFNDIDINMVSSNE
jgi:hypothetical protein